MRAANEERARLLQSKNSVTPAWAENICFVYYPLCINVYAPLRDSHIYYSNVHMRLNFFVIWCKHSRQMLWLVCDDWYSGNACICGALKLHTIYNVISNHTWRRCVGKICFGKIGSVRLLATFIWDCYYAPICCLRLNVWMVCTQGGRLRGKGWERKNFENFERKRPLIRLSTLNILSISLPQLNKTQLS
jgi:hypothetical protein